MLLIFTFGILAKNFLMIEFTHANGFLCSFVSWVFNTFKISIEELLNPMKDTAIELRVLKFIVISLISALLFMFKHSYNRLTNYKW